MLKMVVPAGNLTVAMDTGDLQSWDTLFAPDDDIHGALLAELQRAVAVGQGVECHSSQYGFTDQDIADTFPALAGNVKSRFLFDKTQAGGPKERPIIASLRSSIPPSQMAVGTSKVAHAILHTKAVALLYPDGTGWTMTGSFNLSDSAAKQFNVVDIVRSRSRALLFASKIDAMFDWVAANEPQT